MLNLYKVTRSYKYATIIDMCWAENENDVYLFMFWDKKDKPPLIIQKIDPIGGIFLSVSIK